MQAKGKSMVDSKHRDGRGGLSKANLVAFVAIAVVVAAALVVAVVLQGGLGSSVRLRAVVHDSEGGVHELPLSQDAELPVTTALGTNVVVVENRAVYVREADCDNQDCVHQGKLDAPGRQIICLPHKLWVEVVPEGEAGGSMNVGAATDGVDVVSR